MAASIMIKDLVRQRLRSMGYMRSPLRGYDLYSGYDRQSMKRRRFYNVGAGTFRHPYWTNIDHGTKYYASQQSNGFVEFDLMSRGTLPIDTGVAEIVYSSHAIEHVDDAAVENLLKEAHRILKPGGIIRLTTPDAQLGFRAYQRRDRSFWYWARNYSAPGTWETRFRVPLGQASLQQLFLLHYASQLCEVELDQTAARKYSDAEIDAVLAERSLESALDFFTKQCRFNPERAGNHMNWWTHDKLTKLLELAGFRNVYRSGFGQSAAPPLRDIVHFDNTHPAISLFVEATKD